MSLLISFFLFLSPSVHAEQTIYTGLFSKKAIKGYDPVAYFLENKSVKGNPKINYSWSDVIWYFSSETNMNLFKNEPTKYAPQYGGWCAFAMADGTKVGIDPKSFNIINGKLYLNYNKKIQKKWQKKTEKYIPKADKNWDKI